MKRWSISGQRDCRPRYATKMRMSLFLASCLIFSLGATTFGVEVEFVGIVGVDKNGNPAIVGQPGVRETTWVRPHEIPIDVLNVFCPDDEHTVTQTWTRKILGTVEVGAEAGIDWGVVNAQLSAKFGIEIGREKSLSISHTFRALKHISVEVTIYTRYQRRRYKVDGRMIDIRVPLGWWAKRKHVNPKCPDKKTSDARTTLDSYGKGLPSGPLKAQILAVVAQLDDVLAQFDTADPAELLSLTTWGSRDAVRELDAAVAMGAEPGMVEKVGFDLTRGTMDVIVDGLITEGTSHITDELGWLPSNAPALAATEVLGAARLLAQDTHVGVTRFGTTADLYAQAFNLAIDAMAFTDSMVALETDMDFLPDPGIAYIVLDNFEAYNFHDNLIHDTWIDGRVNETTAGVFLADAAAGAPVYDGQRAMSVLFNNSVHPHYAEVERAFDGPQDWTKAAVKVLTLWSRGDPANVAEQMYVAVEDNMGMTKLVNHPNPNASLLDTWQEWSIDLQEFSYAGVDLTSIRRMCIGAGDRNNPQVGGTGGLYFDHIGLYLPKCLDGPRADISGDCVVDLEDFAVLANSWLDEGRWWPASETAVGVGIAFDGNDTVGPARILYLYDNCNAAVLEPNDILLEYRGIPVSSGAGLLSAIHALDDVEAGSAISLKVQRDDVGVLDLSPVSVTVGLTDPGEEIRECGYGKYCDEVTFTPSGHTCGCEEDSGCRCWEIHRRKWFDPEEKKVIMTRVDCYDDCDPQNFCYGQWRHGK